jgi:hypothetical protein
MISASGYESKSFSEDSSDDGADMSAWESDVSALGAEMGDVPSGCERKRASKKP